MNKWTLFTKATRFWSFSVMLIPIVLGTVGAYVWEGTFHPVLFILTLIGAISAHLFSNMVNDLWDFRNGTDTEAKNSAGEISTKLRATDRWNPLGVFLCKDDLEYAGDCPYLWWDS